MAVALIGSTTHSPRSPPLFGWEKKFPWGEIAQCLTLGGPMRRMLDTYNLYKLLIKHTPHGH